MVGYQLELLGGKDSSLAETMEKREASSKAEYR